MKTSPKDTNGPNDGCSSHLAVMYAPDKADTTEHAATIQDADHHKSYVQSGYAFLTVSWSDQTIDPELNGPALAAPCLLPPLSEHH